MQFQVSAPLYSFTYFCFFSFSLFLYLLLFVCPFRRSRKPGSAWLSAPKVAREKAMMAPL